MKITLKKSEQGGYKARVSSLPGYISHGISKEETMQRLLDAVFLHLGIEEVCCTKDSERGVNNRYRLRQPIALQITPERKLAVITTLAGLLLMIATIFGTGILFG